MKKLNTPKFTILAIHPTASKTFFEKSQAIGYTQTVDETFAYLTGLGFTSIIITEL